MVDLPNRPAPRAPRAPLNRARSAEISANETSKKEWWRKANLVIMATYGGGLAILLIVMFGFGPFSNSPLVMPLFATAVLMMVAGVIGSFFSVFKPRTARFDLGPKIIFALAAIKLALVIWRMIT